MKIPLFDIDGTLVKTGSSINQNAFSATVKKVYGIDASQKDINPEGMVDNQILVEVLKIHGLSEEEVRQKIDLQNQAVAEYAKQHEDEINLEVLPGVNYLLETLRKQNIPMGVLTGNVEGLAWVKLDKTNLKEFFKFGAFGSQAHIRSELVEIARKNAQKALGKNLNTQDFAIVGDTPKDIQCARDAGIKVAAVATGTYSYDELAREKPDLLVRSLEGNEGQQVIDFLNN